MRSISSTEQRFAAYCGKAVSRVIAPLPARGGALSEDEFRSEVVASQPSEASSPEASNMCSNMATEEVSIRMVVEPEQTQGRAAYVVTECAGEPVLQEPIFNPAQYEWAVETNISRYRLSLVELAGDVKNIW